MTEERTGSCAICQERDPLPDLEPACGPCRSRGRNQLLEIPQLVDELAADPEPSFTPGEERIEEHADHLIELDEGPTAVVRVEYRHLVEVAAGAVPGQSGAPRVSASKEAPVPVNLDRLDLLTPARTRSSATKDLAYPEQDDDQIGYLSVATTLDGWCRDWAGTRRESVPAPIVAGQCRWLLDRWDWACDEHPAIDEFAAELADVWHALRRAAGLTMPKPELCVGIPCKSIECDLRTLYRVPGSDFIECASCGLLLTEDEYRAWCKLLAAAAKGRG